MAENRIDAAVLIIIVVVIASAAAIAAYYLHNRGGKAEFEVTATTIPPGAEAGENFTITAFIKNVGGSEGTYTTILFIDNEQVEAKDVTIPAEATRTVHFSLVKDVNDIYVATVGGISKPFSVGPPIKIIAENCFLEQDNIVIKNIGVTEFDNVDPYWPKNCERLVRVDYYEDASQSPPYTGETSETIYQFPSSVEAHNFFENRASRDNEFIRVDVGNEGLYFYLTIDNPWKETFFRIKNCVISILDIMRNGTEKGFVYAVILSERFKTQVEGSWKKAEFEAKDKEFQLEKDGAFIKGMYVENLKGSEGEPGLEDSIIIRYATDNGPSILEIVTQFQDNEKAHASFENSRKMVDYAAGPVKVGDEGYVFAFTPGSDLVPGVVFRVRNVQIMLLSFAGPDNSLAYCRIIEEKCGA